MFVIKLALGPIARTLAERECKIAFHKLLAGALNRPRSNVQCRSSGKLIFHIFGALAEFERDLIRERTHAGLAAARARGRKGGRPRVAALSDEKRFALALSLYTDKNNSVQDIITTLNVSRATFYRYIAHQKTADQKHRRA